MSKKQPIEIKISDNLTVHPDSVHESEVVSSGNGAVIKFFKRFLGRKVVVIVKEEKK